MTGLEAPLVIWLLSMLGGRRGAPAAPSPRQPPPAPPPPAPPPPAPEGEREIELWPRTVPKGGEVPITRTWPATQGGADEWRRDRYAQVLSWLQGPAKLLPEELAHVKDIAISVLAHWDLEAASGLAEYNWNAGGIGARPGDQYFASQDAQSQPPAPMAFAAYDTFPQFVADYFGVLALPRYSKALSALMMTPATDAYIRALRGGGYYSAPEDTVAAAWKARRALVAKAVG